MTDVDPIRSTLGKLRLIPVVSLPDAALAEPLADCLVQAGLPCVEITFRTAAAADAIQAIARRGDVFVAAGTVLDTQQAQRALDAGAQCLLSPGLDSVVVDWCADNSMLMIPGVATPSEIMHAKRMGLSLLKFFPAEPLGGAGALKTLAGPLPGIQFIPTGGIGPANLLDYLALPSVLACGGSWMVSRDRLMQRDFAGIQASVQEAVNLAQSIGDA